MSVLFGFCCCCCCYFPKWKAHLAFCRTMAHLCHLHNPFLHCKSVPMKHIHHLHRRTRLLNNLSLGLKGNKNKKCHHLSKRSKIIKLSTLKRSLPHRISSVPSSQFLLESQSRSVLRHLPEGQLKFGPSATSHVWPDDKKANILSWGAIY